MIVILDYGAGNLGSVVGAVRRQGEQVVVSDNPDMISNASRFIIPGVGAYDAAAEHIDQKDGLREAIDFACLVRGIPTLGICLGAQLLMSGSAEGERLGLGFIAGEAKRLTGGARLKTPHIGWGRVIQTRPTPLLNSQDDWEFYFVHSFAPFPENKEFVLAESSHGSKFPSIVGFDNIFGVQFHPEKSHGFGDKLFRNFLRL